MKITSRTYRQIVSNISDASASFDVVTMLPVDRRSAQILVTEFNRMFGGRTPSAFYHFELRLEDDYRTHSLPEPEDCDPRFTRMLRKHLSRIRCADDWRVHASRIRSALGIALQRRWNAAAQETAATSLLERIRKTPLAPGSGIYKYSRAIGIEIEGTSPLDREDLEKRLPLYARTAMDGSIRVLRENHYAVEVRMLLERGSYEPRLARVCAALASNGFEVNKSCGLHIHMDARHLSVDARRKIQRVMTAWLKILAELVPLSRRDNSYCRLALNAGRYCAVSTETGGKQTIEVRLHSATSDQTKITMWIRLLELLSVLPAPKRSLASTLAALESLPLCDWDKNYWRQRHRELNPTQYNQQPTTNENE